MESVNYEMQAQHSSGIFNDIRNFTDPNKVPYICFAVPRSCQIQKKYEWKLAWTNC